MFICTLSFANCSGNNNNHIQRDDVVMRLYATQIPPWKHKEFSIHFFFTKKMLQFSIVRVYISFWRTQSHPGTQNFRTHADVEYYSYEPQDKLPKKDTHTQPSWFTHAAHQFPPINPCDRARMVEIRVEWPRAPINLLLSRESWLQPHT